MCPEIRRRFLYILARRFFKKLALDYVCLEIWRNGLNFVTIDVTFLVLSFGIRSVKSWLLDFSVAINSKISSRFMLINYDLGENYLFFQTIWNKKLVLGMFSHVRWDYDEITMRWSWSFVWTNNFKKYFLIINIKPS